jgi:hypothetical protein
LEIFRGTLPPQHSARKDDCLSAKRDFRLCSEARRRRVEKCEAPRPQGGAFPVRKCPFFDAPLIPAIGRGLRGALPVQRAEGS